MNINSCSIFCYLEVFKTEIILWIVKSYDVVGGRKLFE
jgi:hypothetical protein